MITMYYGRRFNQFLIHYMQYDISRVKIVLICEYLRNFNFFFNQLHDATRNLLKKKNNNVKKVNLKGICHVLKIIAIFYCFKF